MSSVEKEENLLNSSVKELNSSKDDSELKKNDSEISDCKEHNLNPVKIHIGDSISEELNIKSAPSDIPNSTFEKSCKSESDISNAEGENSIENPVSKLQNDDSLCTEEKNNQTNCCTPEPTVKNDSKSEILKSKYENGFESPVSKLQNGDSLSTEEKNNATHCCTPKPALKDDSIKVKEGSTKYYAVALPSSIESANETDELLVFGNKIDALKALKKYPEARLREFGSKIEAIKYASIPLSSQASPLLKDNVEKSLFKSISSQEMVQLRKAIERGNEGLFLEKVWSNPRYLINNADGPTVMQEGTRYNALHVAARFRQTGMCLTVLSVIHDKQFISAMYPDDKPSMIEERVKHLVDLYLNMPDKSLSETPVHFACKFGCDPVLKILLSYPQCDINKLNKYGLSPKDVICDRHACSSTDHKKKMASIFKEIFYVPIMRDETHNFIGQPCRANAVIAATSYSTNKEKNLSYCAFAGPMSEAAAAKFCTLLKTKRFIDKADIRKVPFSPEEKTLLQICLSDPKKGLERVGRKVAKDLKTGWLEFWGSLDCWLDLSSEFGLDYLNNYLKKQEKMIYSEEDSLPSFRELVANFTDDFVKKLPLILINMNEMTYFHQFQTLVQHMCCFTKYTFSDEKEISLIHEEIGHLLYLKLCADKNNFDALKFYLNTQSNVVDNVLAQKCSAFLCVLKFACYFNASSAVFLKVPECKCKFVQKSDIYDFSSKSCYSEVLALRQEYVSQISKKSENDNESSSIKLSETQSSANNSDDKKSLPNLNEPFDETHLLINRLSLDCETQSCKSKNIVTEKRNSFLSPSGIYQLFKKLRKVADIPEVPLHQEYSYKSDSPTEEEEEEEEEDRFFTPPESPSNSRKRVFVNDQELSDEDIDMFRAIVDAGVLVNKMEYPYVFSWKCLMESELGSVLKPDDKVSCTPTSSSASVRKAITPKLDSLRRTLF